MNYPYNNLENFTLPNLLDRSISLYGDNPIFSTVEKTPKKYNDFYIDVKRVIKLLQDNGISKGDKVVLLSENMPNWATAYFSVTYFGAVIVPILPDFHPSDIHHIIKHSEAKAIFVSKRHLDTVEDSKVNFIIELDTLNIIDTLTNKNYISSMKDKGKQIADNLLSTSKEVYEDDLCAIIYTSGTTGHSKGVMLSHKNIVTNAMSSYSKINISESDRFLSLLPLAHTFECTVGMIIPILHGSSVFYIDKTPTPNVLLKAFESVKPTIVLMVPLIIEKIYKTKILSKINSSYITRNLYKVPYFKKKLDKIAGKKLLSTFGGNIKFIGIGGAPLASYVEEFLMNSDFPYLIGYGLTETAPLIAGTSIHEKKKLGSTGTVFYGVDVKLKNVDEKSGEGEIIVKSPSLMLGYYKDEEKTKEVMENGWFLTGDLASIDDDGYIFIRGRSKNVIIGPSGENIYPEHIESVINRHEAVLESIVFEKENKIVAKVYLDYELIDEKYGTRKLSDSKIKKKIDKILEDIRNDVNSKISSFSRISKFIEQTEPFVKTPTKKIKRYLYE